MILSLNGRGTRTKEMKAFSLLEVMIAMAILFMALFGILGIVSQNLRAARSLTVVSQEPTAGDVAAEMSMTNKLFEGTETGDFGELHPEFSWIRDTVLVTNGLFEVEVAVLKDAEVRSTLKLLLYRPESSGSSGRPGDGTGTRGNR